ncbi:hypothetical protein IMG5_113460 [Ichthyophthirius multifiliis]|uniref:Tetratricopeptide repeat protein n=1 Tax=Ichthyophthirius multifiliis TaxID=5932 RepID=G0QU05_ICHMU|nr:hypothetical protein IMG5_113460 [Ichthyophthirius multifiliis]EGR31309.1 hypothetical protein IMG5_113460 [Ichthyophthirius multifiliis]|eukprot:XP_004034795.1 hypothetical protein IMG5_113460 [Ichthyophthirius multifiliis]
MKKNSNASESIIYKEEGNKAFKNKNYEEAILMYTNAIVNLFLNQLKNKQKKDLDQTQSIFYSNRSRVYKHLNKIDEAIQDAQKSYELDEKIQKHIYQWANQLHLNVNQIQKLLINQRFLLVE